MDLVTLSAAFGASKKYTDSVGSGISSIQVSPDGTSIIFTATDGDIFPISVEDWNAITLPEKEKIDKIVVSGNGTLFLSNDGSYKAVTGGTADYNVLSNKPNINGVELIGSKTSLDLGFSSVSTTGSYDDLSEKPTIPSLTSQLSNDSGFVISSVDNLINYYLKVDTYTKTEVNGLIGNIASIDVLIVTELPTQDISLATIYLIQIPETNIYSQWMYISNNWANIGSTSIDLSDYYNKIVIDDLLSDKVDKVVGYGLSQESFTTAEKSKLASLENYVPPVATTTSLGEVMVDGISLYVDENGVISAAAGGGGLPPSNVSGLSITANVGSLTVKWSDPDNLVIDEQTLSTWKGTKLLYKKTGFPIGPSDGVLAVDNQVKDTYSATGFTINGLATGLYYIKLFPYSDTYAYNISEANQTTGDVLGYKTMTVIIDTLNSNPLTSVTYADDALTMTPGSANWDTWFGYYPCLFNQGSEVGKLNPNNFGQFADGSSADITSGNAGDVMIGFPRKGLKIETVGNLIYVRMTDNPNDENFEYNAHRRNGVQSDVQKNIFYIGAYEGSYTQSRWRSLSGKMLSTVYTTNKTIQVYRNGCHANGTGYEMFAFYQLTFIQAMYLLKYKNLNSQATVGYGLVGASGFVNTGSTNLQGMNYGSTTNNLVRMKLFGIEDLWGNTYDFIDGVKLDGSGYLLAATTDFNDSGSGYTIYGRLTTGSLVGYLKNVQGTSAMGFTPKTGSGSATTYFCDHMSLWTGAALRFGGTVNETTIAGIFCQQFNIPPTSTSATTQARLMYL